MVKERPFVCELFPALLVLAVTQTCNQFSQWVPTRSGKSDVVVLRNRHKVSIIFTEIGLFLPICGLDLKIYLFCDVFFYTPSVLLCVGLCFIFSHRVAYIKIWSWLIPADYAEVHTIYILCMMNKGSFEQSISKTWCFKNEIWVYYIN